MKGRSLIEGKKMSIVKLEHQMLYFLFFSFFTHPPPSSRSRVIASVLHLRPFLHDTLTLYLFSTPLLCPKKTKFTQSHTVKPPRSMPKTVSRPSLSFPEPLHVRNPSIRNMGLMVKYMYPVFSKTYSILNAERSLVRLFRVCTSLLCTSSLSSS